MPDGAARVLPMVAGARNLDGWWHHALCSNPDREFYSEPKTLKEEEKSKSVCRVCPVRLECLAHAFCTSTEDGIFGGMNFGKINKSFMVGIFKLPIQAGEVAVVVALKQNMSD